MQSQTLVVEEFLKQYRKKAPLLIDTRSEKEFEKAHIPGAVNIPILNNEHRHIVGTIYKQEGRQAAVMKGFELVGPLFKEKMETAVNLAEGREVFVYCWRGGMRSNILAWLLKMAGMRVTLLQGGYKSFRNYLLPFLSAKYRIIVLGGQTGSGKTEMLHRLRDAGEQVVDLEYLASHKGSAFGLLGMPEQPSQEQFENLLALELEKIDPRQPVWFENESRLIGKMIIPPALFEQMRSVKVVEVQVSREQREERIRREYCVFDAELLAHHTDRIAKRLGPQHAKRAIGLLHEGDKDSWLQIVLDYYDKTYTHSNTQRDAQSILSVVFDWEEPELGVRRILHAKDKMINVIN
ncbi:MAG: tRNA 2-selenouridine(34) synthase MnmH [Bacteroidia bacterium]